MLSQQHRRTIHRGLTPIIGEEEVAAMLDEFPLSPFDAPVTAGRFDERSAEVDDRFSQVDLRFAQVDRRFEQVDRRFDQVDRRFEQVDLRFDQIDLRFERLGDRMDRMDERFDRVEQRMDRIDGRFDLMELHAIEVDKHFLRLRSEMHESGRQLMMWSTSAVIGGMALVASIMAAFGG